MAQIYFQINGAEQVSRNLRVMVGKLEDTQGFLKDAIGVVEKYSKQAFEKEGMPEKWRELAASTQAARRKRTGYYKRSPSGTPKILHWTGNLENNNKKTVKKDMAIFEKLAHYAPYHQYGGKNGRPPQRKVLTLDPRAAAEIVRLLQKKINDSIGISGLQA